MNAEDFLTLIVAGLVDNPDDVKVVRTQDEMGVLLTLTVNPGDMGRVIGREGSTAKALRTILRTAGMKNDERLNLKIAEPDGSDRRPYERDTTVDDVIRDLKS